MFFFPTYKYLSTEKDDFDHFNTPKFRYDYAQHPEGWYDEYVFTTRLLSCFQEEKYETKNKTSLFLQFCKDLWKQLVGRCDIWQCLMSLQMLSSVFANVSVHHRLVLMKGVLAARVIQLCVYHRALEERKGQNRASQGSESGLQISHFYHTFLTLPTLRRWIRAEKRSGIRRFFSELPQFSFIHCLNTSSSIKFSLSQIHFGWSIRVIGCLLSH